MATVNERINKWMRYVEYISQTSFRSLPQTFGINSARIVSKDHAVSNGIVHVIDEVLWPPEGMLMEKIQEDPQMK